MGADPEAKKFCLSAILPPVQRIKNNASWLSGPCGEASGDRRMVPDSSACPFYTSKKLSSIEIEVRPTASPRYHAHTRWTPLLPLVSPRSRTADDVAVTACDRVVTLAVNHYSTLTLELDLALCP